MNADDGTGRTKLQAAKEVLRGLVDELPDGASVGLRVYGHRVPNTDRKRGCKDTELIVPVRPLDRPRLKTAISRFDAKGFTPIGLSLKEGARDLPPEGERTIILVSDGIDTCAPPPPCEVARRLEDRDVDIAIEAVGFQVDARAREELKCIARATGASYRNAPNAAALADSLRAISTRALRTYRSPGEPVQGGPAFRDAPLLDSGIYQDTLLPDESLWYAVALADGQSLVVRATLDRLRSGLEIGALFEVQVVAPNLEDLCCEGERGYQVNLDRRVVSAGARTGTVGLDEELASGTYYVRVTSEAGGPAREQPLEIELEVIGAPIPSPEPTPTATPTAATESPNEDDEGPLAAREAGSSGLLVALVVLLAVLVVLLAIVAALLWRRSASSSRRP